MLLDGQVAGKEDKNYLIMKQHKKNKIQNISVRDKKVPSGGMMIKKVTLFTDPKDPYCVEIEKFLRSLEIILTVRDIRKTPLNYRQLTNLFKSFDLDHFINPCSTSTKSKSLDVSEANRKEALQRLADDNTLLRRPIIVCGRLMTIGYDRRRITEMLQVDAAEAGAASRAGTAA